MADALAYKSLICDSCDVILKALHYGEEHAWENVYRPQSIRACLDTYGEKENEQEQRFLHDKEERMKKNRKSFFFNFLAWYQVWSERVFAMRELTLSKSPLIDEIFYENLKDVNVDRAKEKLKLSYEALDAKLEESSIGDDGIPYILGTTMPTLLDTILFAHIAEALCDVHAITVLAPFKNLIIFFQNMYKKYFGADFKQEFLTEKIDSDQNDDLELQADWISWNEYANAVNSFNKVSISGSDSNERYEDSIKLIKTLALQCNDLPKTLKDTTIKRSTEDMKLFSREQGERKTASNFFHKLMFGGLFQQNEFSTKTSADSGILSNNEKKR